MIDIQTFYKKLKKGYKKNLREYTALKNRLYPQFVFEENPITIKDEIPVFTLHSVNPQRFEEQLIFLSQNGYITLNADNFYECLIGSKPITERTILLTFDDGWKNLYTVAYPLLKKYKFCAICFLIPNIISEEENTQPEIIIQKNSKTFSMVPDSDTLCNWEEIKEMHRSGVIDFQSHSMNHYLIFTSSKIADFVHPKFNAYAMNLDMPLMRFDGQENYSRVVNLGTPIYEHASRFSGKKRYFDDENLRLKCTEYVKFNGGKNFFEKFNWRKKLTDIVNNYCKKENNYPGFYETESELRESIFNELRDSKLMIQSKLHDKSVIHFCYPWWEGSEIASEISREAGYLSNFWGVLPGRRTNRKGDDPYKISRLLSDDYIFRLPGIGRKSHFKIIREKLLQNKNVFKSGPR
jgi:peptidoglycan/xylan/chitin deacetylase (PgdA/CDA1 family)